ncbi:helix-turn-helix domain-containing protein [Aurantibacillus circumpalustris]|uniref:helix-turn-helix domain-containing protein n=1 Tax=Aurantibacillus circumpalustris TaxID=3036359 RepID=UPI00295AE05E|nr:helix-turn-helix transcriptional regulator [Aurantibacillus circumpalustris]
MKKVNTEEKKYLKALGNHIAVLRKKRGLTQVQLAKKLGTEHPQIGRLERGETNATIIILRKIAKELNINVSELVSID